MSIKVHVHVPFDREAKVFVASNSNLRSLVAEAETLDELVKNLNAGVADLLSSYVKPPAAGPPRTSLTFEGVEDFATA